MEFRPLQKECVKICMLPTLSRSGVGRGFYDCFVINDINMSQAVVLLSFGEIRDCHMPARRSFRAREENTLSLFTQKLSLIYGVSVYFNRVCCLVAQRSSSCILQPQALQPGKSTLRVGRHRASESLLLLSMTHEHILKPGILICSCGTPFSL